MSTRWTIMAALGAAAMLTVVGRSFGRQVSAGDLGQSPIASSDAVVDPLYFFDFSGGGVTGHGILNLSDTANPDGSYNVIGGNGYIYSSLYTGSISLIGGNTTYPNYLTSPSGAYTYDNVVYFPPTTQAGASDLDSNALLFGTPAGSSIKEVNIWGNGGTTDYTVSEGIAQWNWPLQVNNAVTFTLVPVPLPAAAGIGFSMLGGFGALFGVRKRLSRRPRIA